MKIIFEQSGEYLTTHTGLTAVGALLSRTKLSTRLNKTARNENTKPVISHADVAKSYIGLLCQGKSDFDHIEPFREDDAFAISMQLKQVPSSPTLRQRLDMAASTEDWSAIALEESADLLHRVQAPLTGVQVTMPDGSQQSMLPLDIDVSPFDNSGTKKEGVSRTYKGHDGYAPIFAYLGNEGYGTHVQLREGSTHVQKNVDVFLKESIGYARRITSDHLLLRMDAGNDSKKNLEVCHHPDHKGLAYIIKRNLRRESKELWLQVAQQHGMHCEEREGKQVYMGALDVREKGFDVPLRQVFRVVERTITKEGQIMMIPEIEVQVYWTSLRCSPWQVIRLYHDHGTSEQFHSEIKTDMDLERLPAGKFATNDLILHFGILAYNILRIIGQYSLTTPVNPLRTNVKRRRIKTVIQNMIYVASRMVRHARQLKFAFGRHSPWFPVLQHIHRCVNA